MAFESESASPLDSLWKEYARAFQDWDDLTLARWLAQTLGQLEGRAWRLSHPLVGAYRLGAQLAHDRQIWFKRLATPPAAYAESPCCRAPFLPLLTRDVRESGLICQHCSETLVPFEEIPAEVRAERRGVGAAIRTRPCRRALGRPPAARRGKLRCGLRKRGGAGGTIARARGPRTRAEAAEVYPTVIWEDQDECLEVRPEDVPV